MFARQHSKSEDKGSKFGHYNISVFSCHWFLYEADLSPQINSYLNWEFMKKITRDSSLEKEMKCI